MPHMLHLKKVREKSRECHNHKPQPFPDIKRKRKPTNPNKHKSIKHTKSTKISSLFPKRGNHIRQISHTSNFTYVTYTSNKLRTRSAQVLGTSCTLHACSDFPRSCVRRLRDASLTCPKQESIARFTYATHL